MNMAIGLDIRRLQTYRVSLTVLVISLCTIVAMIARRPDQWTAPTLWVEDTKMLAAFAESGWISVFYPVNGYILLPSKFILCTSALLSFRWLPEISYWMALIFTIAVLLCIALSPTTLKYRKACALATLALPINSEVYATSEYTFWWGSLLTILPLFWDGQNRRHTVLRIVFLLIGGFSSPLIVALAPVYFVRAILTRQRSAWLDFGISALVAATQLTLVHFAGQASPSNLLSFEFFTFVRKFFGYFIYDPIQGGNFEIVATALGLLLIAASAYIFFVCRNELSKQQRNTAVVLAAITVLTAFLSATRVPLPAIHPASAGPRYFFLPFTLLSWFFLQMFALNLRAAQMIAVVVLALSMRTAIDIGQRRHDVLDWRGSVEKCLSSERFNLPVHFDGVSARAWNADLQGDQCRRMVRDSWFDNQIRAF